MTTTRSRTFDWKDPTLTSAPALGMTGLAYLRAMLDGKVPPPPIGFALDFFLVAAEEGFARFRGVPGEYHYNPMGSVHGGIVATLLDSALGCAVLTTLDAQSGYTTAQLAVNLVRPITVATGPIYAEGRIVHRGSRVATSEAKLLDEAGKLYAHGTTTCLILPR